MALIQWTCIFLLTGLGHCYVNLSRKIGTSVSQSSNENGHFPATNANDGNRDNTDYTTCAHTAIKQSIAWFQVDLGGVYSLKSVKIYYRNQDGWPPYRFRQFYLDVSNGTAASTTTLTSQRTRCYTDNTTAPATPPSVIDIPCKQTARYVIVETTYSAQEAINRNAPGPVLEICEIEVYGCEVGRYGETCSSCIGCSACDIITGKCLHQVQEACDTCVEGACTPSTGYCTNGCITGYWGNTCKSRCNQHCFGDTCEQGNGTCTNGCVDFRYGYTCEHQCGTQCSPRTCDRGTGMCNSCNTGYYGTLCDKTCSPYCNSRTCNRVTGLCNGCTTGYWGNICNLRCDQYCLGSTCEQGNGTCTNGCVNFYYGYTCNHQCGSQCNPGTCDRVTGVCSGCNTGFYGLYCNKTCSPYCNSGTCDPNNGHCTGGCKENWTGEFCNKCDALHFGRTCSEKCSVRCKEGVCDDVTGSCTDGCETGYYKDTCNRTCNPGCKDGCNKNSGYCDNGCRDGKFGLECHDTCGSGCKSNQCQHMTGSCTCKIGWKGERCIECSPTFYGASCEEECSPHCYNGTCHVNNGSCIGGCTGEYTGDKCIRALLASSSESSEIPVTAIGAGAGGFVIVLIVVAVTVIMFRLRRKNPSDLSTATLSNNTDRQRSPAKKKPYANIATVSIAIEDPEEEPQRENPEEAIYYNNMSVAKDISVKDLLNVIRQKEAAESAGFVKEFKSIPYGERFPCNTAKLEENKPKNRFKTTFPYDHSRVVLEPSDGFTSDYINANYIENMDGRRVSIASQGPRENTLVDHWRMIWQEHVQYIVMLTNLIEGPKVKCHQYWPDEGHELDVNPFTVTLLEEKAYAYYVIRKMRVRKKRVTGSRTIVQFHYTRWPDHGTPNPLNLVIFHRHFRHKIKPSHHPILVHCSAGIGRTGTFIALDVLSRYGDVHHKVNVVEFVKAMRKDRMTMIQNADQYVFLYHALFEYFRRKGKFVNRTDFMTTYEDLDKPEAKKKITDEFNALKNLRPQYGADDFQTGQKFQNLNLTKSILPVDKYLVYLSSHVKGRESYYNAVSVSSFTRAEEFISAQYPVSSAAVDLVRLLVDQKSPFLISLNPLSDVKEIENWVDGKNARINLVQYEITRNTQTMLPDELRKTNIKIKRKDSGQTHVVQVFECLSWSSSEVLPNEHATLTNLMKQLSLDRKTHPEGPITVVSKDGATCCGLFLAVYNAVEQIQQDDEADIFTIVQQLQCRRPEIISRKEEYEFCFRSVWYYLSSDSTYANT